MYLNLNIKLEKNNFYTSAGNIFSKLLLMRDLLLEERVFLIIVENDKRVLTYKKIAESLNIKLDILDNIGDIINLIFNNKGTFIVNKELFNLDIKDIDTYKFEIKRGNKLLPQDLAKKLNSLGLTFSEYGNPNSFSILGDILKFIDKSGNLTSVSFWDDEIDEILLNNQQLDNYTFGSNQPLEVEKMSDDKRKGFEVIEKTKMSIEMGRLCEENEGLSEDRVRKLSYDSRSGFQVMKKENHLLDLYVSKEIFTILDNIDFYSEYDEIMKKIENNFLVFLAIKK